VLKTLEITKIQAWLGICILSGIQVGLLYTGYDGQLGAIIIPTITYLFGIVTKTAVDKITKNT
jgi:hypothetical protein